MKPNFLLCDRYLIQSKISDKGGRQTFLAQDTRSQDPVVVKIIQFGAVFEWANLKLFEREAQILKNIDHPAIPNYRDYFETEIEGVHSFVLVQAHIEAISLESAIQKGRVFSTAEAFILAERLLEILKYLHEQAPPIVHRDIKPSNILITDANEIYLVDFGSAHTANSRESSTITIVGSYGYIPLEQFAGQAVPASDLYSLGMTIIYLVTGTHPAELPQVKGQVQLGLSQFTPKLARWLKGITHPYLDQRFDSANSALVELRAKTSIAGYHQHLKPARTHVDFYRDCDRLTIRFDRLKKQRASPSVCVFLFFCFFFIHGLIASFLAISSSFVALLFLAVGGLYQLFNLLSTRTVGYRNIIVIDRKQGIRNGIRNNGDGPIEWKQKALPFQNITHLVYNPGYTFDHYYRGGKRIKTTSKAVTVLPKLSIYASNQEYKIEHSNIGSAELCWLGKELSDFVGLDLQTIYPTQKTQRPQYD